MIGQKLIFLDEVDSTNNYTAKLLNEGKLAHGTVILAGKQTAGRGQRGNLWSSNAGNQLACSVYAETAFLSAERYWFLNLAVALAVYTTIEAAVPAEEVRIKWPNDVLINNKKLSGILIETQWRSGAITGAIIGVGINVNGEPDLPSSCALNDFRTNTVGLTPLELAHELTENLEVRFQQLRQGAWNDLLEEYHRVLWRKDVFQFAETESAEMIEGYIRGIDGTGNLLFETEEGIRTFAMKEIAFRY
jgi:BirA family transcriptional regulator, biotin operon repressor / biotin---[acetyl-CoA-carboxylase] ligase